MPTSDADAQARARLSEAARQWLPTLPVDVVDRIVATAWVEALEGGEPMPAGAVAGVRRRAAAILRGQEPDLRDDAEERIAALEPWREEPPRAAIGHRAPSRHDAARFAAVAALLLTMAGLGWIWAGGLSIVDSPGTTEPRRAAATPSRTPAQRRAESFDVSAERAAADRATAERTPDRPGVDVSAERAAADRAAVRGPTRARTTRRRARRRRTVAQRPARTAPTPAAPQPVATPQPNPAPSSAPPPARRPTSPAAEEFGIGGAG